MKIYIAGNIPGDAAAYLRKKKFRVSVYKNNTPVSPDELIKNCRDADGIITLLSNKIDSRFIDQLNRCKVIANYAVGYNNIDVKYAAQKNIVVTNTPDVLTDATADIAMGLVLSCARRFNEGEELVRNKKFKGWQPQMLLGVQLKDKYFGIIGAGRIGTAVAVRAESFGCNIIYHSRSKNVYLERLTGAQRVSLNSLLKKSHFISLHIPLTAQTKHLLNKDNLKLLKQDAVLINTARGEVVDEKELIRLLKNGKILAAGFDVYYNEPKINPELLELKNVVLLPHLGSATVDARREMALLTAKNVAAILSWKPAVTPVN